MRSFGRKGGWGTALAAGLLVLGGCGDENSTGSSSDTSYLVGTSVPVNYNDSANVSQPTGVHPYGTSASKIPDEDLAAKSSGATEQTPAQIATGDSNDTYSDNTSGLITAGTLDGWMNDWANNKPSGISGDLVILEVMDGASYASDGSYSSGGIYFQKDTGNGAGNNVRTYVVSPSEVSETRNNGVVDTVSMVLSEPSMNDFMAKYNIDPANDMVVVAMGNGGGFANMVMGRIWYALRYWGAPAGHLGILNGGATYHNNVGDFSAANIQTNTNPGSVVTGHYNPSIADGSVSSAPTAAGDLPEANMQLMISYGELLKMVAKGVGVPTGGMFIWDVRRAEEFYGLEDQGRGYAFEGHIKGAHWLPYSDLLVPDQGWRYLDKSHLKSKIDGLGYSSGETVITHCVTTYRAMVSGIASSVVLGYPTRLYDGAWIQWGTMAYHMNKQGTYNLPKDSPWRADIAEASRWINYDPNATDSTSSSSSSSNDSVSVPAQGCGG
ncbi:MAG TPA: rhodanese-like domain-containing protein [Gammaproteobacteria bacterium]|nr:rhodanese-like domain-containing protein [Gammaproteobacteria bacterium]